MKIEDLIGMESFGEMTDEKLRELLQNIRHNRVMEVAPRAIKSTKPRSVTLEGKLKKAGVTPEQLLALLEKL